MNKSELLKLEKLSTLSPKEIKRQQASLYVKISERASTNLKNTVTSRLKDAPKEIKDSLAKVDFSPEKLGSMDVRTVLTKKLFTGRISVDMKKRLKKISDKLPELGKLDDIIQPDLPVFVNPVFQPDLMKAKMYRLGDVSGLSQMKLDKALVKKVNLNTISNETLDDLVKDKVLSNKEAKELGLTSNLYSLFDNSFELTEYISKNLRVKSLDDLVKLDKSTWSKLIKDSKAVLPDDLNRDDYAEVLLKKVENIYPEISLVHNFTSIKNTEISKSIATLKPLSNKNKTLFGATTFDELTTDGITAADKKKLKREYEFLDRITKIHPGLNLDSIFNDKNLSEADKAKAVTGRVSLLDKFIKNNAEVNFLSLDYKHDSEDLKDLNFSGFKKEEKAMVLKSVKSYQRIYSFTNDIDHTETILAAGYHSSFQIASETLSDFMKATKLEKDIATKYFENAHMSIIRTTGVMGSILDILTESFDWTMVGNTSTAIKDYLKEIPGYADLFGEMAFCDCEHCQSIYSPAAYFVDLMQFVEKHVLSKHFTGDKEDHVLNLKVRRPDLWNLPVSCENTLELIPYLEVINEILESYIAKKKGFSGDMSDWNAVREFVYKREIALEKPGTWKNSVHSFKQPFHLPIESVSTYLTHFEKTREDIAILLGKTQNDISRARLGLSDKEYTLVTSPDTTPAFINRVYGISFTVTSGKITPFNAQLFIESVGISRLELGSLLSTWFVTDNGSDNIIIKGEKISTDSIQNDIERIKNLTYSALDRAHRFVRLWHKTNWSIEELDLVLSELDGAGISSGIEPDTITEIGSLMKIQEDLKLSVEELCAIFHLLPTKAIYTDSKSLLDALFNHDDVVAIEGTYPKPTVKLIHPALIIDKSTPSAEFSSSRLMAGLNRSDDEILALIQNLASALGIVALDSAIEGERGFDITRENLTLLYQHSKVAEILNVTIQELFGLLQLIPSIPNNYFENVGHVDLLLEFYSWWKSSSFSIDDLNYIIESGNVLVPEDYYSKESVSSYVIEETQSTSSLLFADTIFASFDDITEEQSRELILNNNTHIEDAGDGLNYRLSTSYNPNTALAIPAGITRPEPEIREVLNKYHPQYLIPFYLSGQLQLSEDAIIKIIDALSLDLNDDAYLLELQTTTTPAVALPALIEKLLPLNTLFKDKKYVDEALSYILDNEAKFGITDLNNLTINTIQKLQLFTTFIKINEDGSNNIATLSDVLASFVNATQYQTASQEQLASILNVKEELLASIHPVISGFTDAILALEHYKKLAGVCGFIGISGDVLSKIVSSNYDVLNEAASDLVGAFRSKYTTESERKEKLEKYDDKIRGIKRASLTDYLIHSGFPQFENENDLFHYFLIDTELEGCSRTSRLVAATMSLQLYIHRIFLNLEQDDKAPGSPNRVNIGIDPDDPDNADYKPLPADEWEWRKNYRVWEANRKVFLYPENYIEPELRDNKSPLFEELENELLQQEINADTVIEAYAKYMRGFDEVAHLKIAGSYHEKDEDSETDVLHLFGVTADDPPIYYYRRIENIYYSEKRDDRGVVYNPWQKISVQIPVKKIAPITYNGRLHVFWVRVTTLGNTVFDESRSFFVGYSHKVSIEFTTLKLDGSWTTPQKLNLNDTYPFTGNGVVQDPLAEEHERHEFKEELKDIFRSFPFFFWDNDEWDDVKDAVERLKTPRYGLKPHYEAIDEYTLKGFFWDQVYPSLDGNNRLILSGAMHQLRAAIDFYDLSLQNAGAQISNIYSFPDPVEETIKSASNKPGKIFERSGSKLYRATSPTSQYFDHYIYGSLVVNTTAANKLLKRHWNECTIDSSFEDIRVTQIASLKSGSNLHIINGAYSDVVVDVQGDLLFIQGAPIEGNDFVLKRLGTTLSETLTRTLFTSGVDTTLSIETQKALKEASAPITITNGKIENLVVKDKIDFEGAYGGYYREIFFHIPFLLANHLNSQGKYAEAQKWYHYIFNPSANEVIDVSDPALSEAEKKKMELDRNWQYLEFREINTQKLRDQINNKQAIEVYKKDPFNPHAIARLRMSAYQKSIVMKYIDNLLDWGDQLFTQDTMESVNEASLLYIIAKEILGDQPIKIGSCGEGKVNPKTYENISPLLDKGSEFLAELESYTMRPTWGKRKASIAKRTVDNYVIAEESKMAARKMNSKKKANYSADVYGYNFSEREIMSKMEAKYLPELTVRAVDDKVTGEFSKGTIRGFDWKRDSIYTKDIFRLPSFGWSIVKHVSPVFCVPGNKDLLDYYNRVDDRLFKIRNCMNIQGQVRQLALFAPEIDPRLLVRAKAAGLSLDDILNSTSGNLPPYRFLYILEKAKSFTSVVQGFGSALLSAIERRSNEDLSLLRLTQQQNILEMSSKSRKLDIDSANKGIEVLNDKIESLNYQIDYYNGLITEHLNPNERAQQITRHIASTLQVAPFALDIWAGVGKLIPQLGSPFAMKWGGLELGHSADSWASVAKDAINAANAISASAGLEAGFDRRSEGWKHKKELLKYELGQTNKSLIATQIKRDILIEAQKIHDKNIEHNNDVLDFYGEKFSNLGMYTWLSSTMQRLYKDAFNNAIAIARLAEQAYRYERNDTNTFIDGNYFDSSRGGLLGGEQLLIALQTLEKKYLETNYRQNEIDQSFSLTQINPSALVVLKQTGTCEFSIPEIFFDLFYPGQYRRRIKAVRLTIPSITGPYTNVGATLSLTGSQIRMETKLGDAELKDVPKSRTTIISTSTAQNDSGVFELNFRDDRYMPFEGAGAISAWKLSMPKNFRQFDYNTINDVIIHISYTADYDELFRDKVEEMVDTTEGTLLNILKNKALARTFSFRQEFSNDFHRLTEQAVGTPISFSIQNKHFPLFMNGKNLKVTKANLVLITPDGQTVAGLDISINSTSQTGFLKDSNFGDLYANDLGTLFNGGIIKDHTISIIAAGDVAPAAPAVGEVSAIDVEKLEDIILYVEYKIV